MNNLFSPYECQFNNEERRKLIAKMLKAQREAKGYSQKELCAILGIKPSTYSNYEKCRSDVPHELLVRLSFLYDTSLDVLMQRNLFVSEEKDISEYLKEQDGLLNDAMEKLLKQGVSKEDAENLINPLKQLNDLAREIAKATKTTEI